MVDGKLSNKLSWASFLGAVCVVSIHTPYKDGCDVGWSWWLYQMIANGFSRWAVPFFFASAGYHVARHSGEDGWYSTALRKRVRSLLIPYFAWTIVGAVLFCTLRAAANLMAARPPFAGFPSGWGVLKFLGVHPYDNFYVVLWFLRTLMCLIMLSPVFVVTVRSLRWWLPISFLCLSYVGISGMPYNLAPVWMMYFTAGMAARFAPIHIKSKLFGLFIPVGLIWIAYHKSCLLDSSMTSFDMTPVPAIILIVVGVWALMPSVEIPSTLRRLSFPIYVIHLLVITFARYLLLDCHGMACLVQYLITWFLIVVASAVCAVTIWRSQRLSLIAFGGR